MRWLEFLTFASAKMCMVAGTLLKTEIKIKTLRTDSHNQGNKTFSELTGQI